MPPEKAMPSTEQTEAINLHTYVPFYITRIANRWTSTASRQYVAKFDVGVIEWGVLASLNTDGPGTSLELSKRIEVDSAAVGRSIVRLLKKGYVVAIEGRFKGRSKPIALSSTGADLVAQLQSHALAQEKRLLAPLTECEQDTLRKLLMKVHESIGSLAGD